MTVGSISTGTLRTQDLVPVFLQELGRREHPQAAVLAESALGGEDDDPWWVGDDCAALMEELVDALNETAPDGHFFGAHEGDGADFGFWPISDDSADESPGPKLAVVAPFQSADDKDSDAVRNLLSDAVHAAADEPYTAVVVILVGKEAGVWSNGVAGTTLDHALLRAEIQVVSAEMVADAIEERDEDEGDEEGE
jgi:hypothetical protein